MIGEENRMRSLWLLLLVVAASGCGPRLRYDLRLPERSARLPNGVRLVVLPDESATLAAVVVRYEVGAREDPIDRPGLAHLVEHLAVLERRRPEATLLDELRAHTLYFNAFTSADATTHVALLAPGDVDAVVELMAAELVGNCRAVAPAVFERERLVVRQELRERHRRPGLAAAHASLYPAGNPQAHSVAEEDAGVAAASQSDACAFFDRHYGPGGMTVAIAGRVDAAATARRAAVALGALPARPLPPRSAVPPFADVSRFAELTDEAPGARAVYAWPVPATVSDDAVGFIVQDLESLRDRKLPWTTVFDVRLLRVGDQRLLVVSAGVLEDDQLARVQSTLDSAGIVPDYVGGTFGFEWARYRLLVKMYLSWAELLPRAEEAARLAASGEHASLGAALRAVRDLDAGTVNAARRAIFHQTPLIRIITQAHAGSRPPPPPLAPLPLLPSPAGSIADIEGGHGDGDGGANRPPVPAASSAALEHARSFTLENGMRVILAPQPRSLFPIVSARLVFTAGYAHEPPDQLGLASVTPYLFEVVPRVYPVKGLVLVATPFAVAGVQKEFLVSPDATIFSADALDESLPQLIEGMEAWTTDPFRPPSRKAVLEFMLRSLPALAEGYLLSIAERKVYGADHPYGRPWVTPENLRPLAVDAVRDWKQRELQAANAVLVLVGRFDPARAEGLIRRFFSGWRASAAAPPITAPVTAHGGFAVVGVPSDGRAADLLVSWAGGSGNDERDAARSVLVELLDRGVSTVRDRLAASYGVHCSYQHRTGPGLYVLEGGVAPAQLAAALDEIRNEVQALMTVPGVQRRFALAQHAVLARLLAGYDSAPKLADGLVRVTVQRLPLDRWPHLAAEVAAVRASEVADLARTELSVERMVIVARAPRAALDALAAAGWPVTFLDEPRRAPAGKPAGP
jgi:zinc protease